MKLLQATKFAAEKHTKQRRKDANATPYINHPIEVAEHLVRIGGITDEEILIAALLHDTIEDTDTTFGEITHIFGINVANLVLECTDDKSLAKSERKKLQIINAPHKSFGAKIIKIADKTCNLMSIISDPPLNWGHKQRLDYVLWSEQVVQGLLGVNRALDSAALSTITLAKEKLSENIDYHKLLVWYINHVGEQEGVSFLNDNHQPDFENNELTRIEWQELLKLSKDN